MAAGVLAANHQMNLLFVAVTAWCGIICGDIMLYHLGRRFGLEIVRLPVIGKHVTRQRIERAEQLFERYGIWVVAGGRMIAGVRGAMVVAAGAIRFKFIKFIIADGLAAIASGGLFLFIGYWLGNRLREHMHQVHRYKEYFFAAVVIIALFTILILWMRRPRPHEQTPGTPQI